MNQTLVVPSVTGIDVELQVCGTGGRSYAFIVDWHFRLLIALGWFVLSSIIGFGSLEWVSDDAPGFRLYLWLVLIPSLILYVFYHPVLEVLMAGRTPGKRIAGVRIVTTEGHIPTAGALLIRNILRLLDSLPAGYVIGIVATLLTHNQVRIGDLAAGTLLVYDTEANNKQADSFATASATVGALGLDKTDLIQDLLARWDDLSIESSSILAAKLLNHLGHTQSNTSSNDELRTNLERALAESSHPQQQ